MCVYKKVGVNSEVKGPTKKWRTNDSNERNNKDKFLFFLNLFNLLYLIAHDCRILYVKATASCNFHLIIYESLSKALNNIYGHMAYWTLNNIYIPIDQLTIDQLFFILGLSYFQVAVHQ